MVSHVLFLLSSKWHEFKGLYRMIKELLSIVPVRVGRSKCLETIAFCSLRLHRLVHLLESSVVVKGSKLKDLQVSAYPEFCSRPLLLAALTLWRPGGAVVDALVIRSEGGWL